MGSRLMALGAGGQVGYQLIEVAKVADATWWDCPISKRTFATLMWRSRDMRQPATPLLIPPTTSQRARHRGDRLSKRLHHAEQLLRIAASLKNTYYGWYLETVAHEARHQH